MKIVKICMECGNEFEDDIKFNDILSCPKCGSGDIAQPTEVDYYDVSMEECFISYFTEHVVFECNGDRKEMVLVEE